ncbi:MAG: DUF3368 domain-containing protein [Myxococcales bacterium]|nr:DUF3368 domain-containing protein [Myxococcales bacterium]
MNSDPPTHKLVINTGPVIALTLCGTPSWLNNFPHALIAPDEVRREFDQGPRGAGSVVWPDVIRVESLKTQLPPKQDRTLDEGEAAVIQLAMDLGIPDVLIDEQRGRKAARANGLRVHGTLWLLREAKEWCLISHVAPLIEQLRLGGYWFDNKLVEEFLRRCGEWDGP